jgi:hypothetical protein
MRSLRLLFLTGAAMMICLLSAGCAEITLGPRIATKIVVLYPGKPLEVLDQVKVKARVLDGSSDPVIQDIGGWICLPPEHWAAVQRALEANKGK